MLYFIVLILSISSTKCNTKYCAQDTNCGYYRECCTNNSIVPKAFSHLPRPSCVFRNDIVEKKPIFIINTCQPWHVFREQNPHLSRKQYRFLLKGCHGVRKRVNHIFHKGRIRMKVFPLYHETLGVIFHNVFCALCNGYHDEDLKRPNLKKDVQLICNSEKDRHKITNRKDIRRLRQFLKKGICNFTFYTFFAKVARSCLPNLISNCSKDRFQKQILIDNCSFKSAYDVWECKHKSYRNKYCVQCNYKDNSYNHICKAVRNENPFFDTSRIPPISQLNTMPSNMMPISDFDFTSIIDNDDTLMDSLENCHEMIMQKPKWSYEMISRYLRNILALVSIVALVVLLTFFVWTNQYKSNVDFINWGLSLSIIFYLLMDLESWFADISDVTCRIKIFFKHTALLSTFLWMLLFGISLLRTFSLSRRYSHHSVRGKLTKKKVIFNLMLALVLPSIYTASLIVTDTIVQPSADEVLKPIFQYLPGFITGCSCWYNHWKALLIWLFLPTAIFVIANTVICVIVLRIVIAMHKENAFAREAKAPKKTVVKSEKNLEEEQPLYSDKGNTSEVRNKNKEQSLRQLFYLCLKLTIILGSYWIFLFISIIVNINIFKVIMASLCQAQGLFISLSILLTARNFKKFKEKVSSKSATNSTAVSNSKNNTKKSKNSNVTA